MSDELYDVFITGLTDDPEAVSRAIAEEFGISIEDARGFVVEVPRRVKSAVSRRDAARMEDMLSGTGAVTRVKKSGASTIPPPGMQPVPPPGSMAQPPPPGAALGAPQEEERSIRVPAAVTWGLIALVIVGVWFVFFRLPTMGGLGVRPLGASDGDAVVLLHGYGAPGDDLVPLARDILSELPDLRVVVVEAPHNAGLGGRAWYNSPDTRDETIGMLRRLLAELEMDGSPRDRTVLLGFSQGAELAALTSGQEALGGTVLLAGPPTRIELRGPVFIAHGRADPIIGFAGAERLARWHGQTADVTWVAFDGGHSTQPARDDLIAWLRAVFED